MKIFYVSHLGNKHSYTTAFSDLWREQGHEVKLFQMYEYEKDYSSNDPSLSAQDMMNKNFIEQCLDFKPDMLFVFKGDSIYADALKEVKGRLSLLMITWWVDNPFTAIDAHFNSFVYSETIKALPLWDYFFVFETYAVTRLRRMGVPAYYLPSAADADHFYIIQEQKMCDQDFYGSDLSFVGTPDKKRADMLRVLDGHDIKLWGPPWNDDYFKAKQLKSDFELHEVRQVYNYTKINLNHHFYANVTGANIRTFDVPACGGFLLTDRMKDIVENLYTEGEEVICYNDLNDLKDKVSYFLNNENERREIANNAYRKTMTNHLFKHRVERIADIISDKMLV